MYNCIFIFMCVTCSNSNTCMYMYVHMYIHVVSTHSCMYVVPSNNLNYMTYYDIHVQVHISLCMCTFSRKNVLHVYVYG